MLTTKLGSPKGFLIYIIQSCFCLSFGLACIIEQITEMRFFLLFIAYLLSVSLTSAQSNNFKTYGKDDGLTDLYIYSIAQDSKGYLWAGTGSSFLRFDGKHFDPFSTNSGEGNNFVKSTLQDQDGKLWVGHYNGGVSYYNSKTSKFIAYALDDKASSSVNQLLQGENKSIWAITQRSGIFQLLSDGSYQHYSSPAPFLLLYTMAILPDKKVLLGTNEGLKLCSFENKKIRIIKSFERTENSEIRKIQPSNQPNQYWVCSDNAGVLLFSPDSMVSQLSTQQGLPSNNVQTVLQVSEHELWIGTADKGLALIDLNLPVAYQVKAIFNTSTTGEKDNYIQSLFKDSEGNIWVGTYGGGLWVYRGGMFSFYNDGKSLRVYSIAQSKKNTYLLGAENGIISLEVNSDAEVFNELPEKHLLKNQKINALLSDQNGNIWAGSDGGGLFFKNSKLKKWQSLNNREDMDAKKVKSIINTNNDEVWLSTTLRGMYQFIPSANRFKNYSTRMASADNPHNQIFPDNISRLLASTDGKIWFITPGSGVSYLEDGKIQLISDDAIKNIEFTCIAEDYKKNIWLGTSGFGAFKYDGTSFTRLTTEEGLLSNYITTIGCDTLGNIWFGSSNGLTKFEMPKNLIRVFGENEGLIEVAISPNAFLADNSGNIWFGTNKGALKYDPSKDNYNTQAPKTYITKMTLNEKKVDLNSTLSFPYSTYKVEFDFIGLTLKDPEKVKYQYQLLGFDDEWRNTSERSISYPKIENGVYTFKVRAVNSDGVWTETSTSVEFSIGKPIWKEPLFYIVLFLILGASIFSFNRARTARLKQANLKLEEKVNERTKELAKEKQKLEKANTKLDHQNHELEEAYQKLVNLEEFKDKMTGMIVHDMKNPLNSIIALSEEQPALHQSGKQMLQMVLNILDVQKFEDTTVQLHLGEYSLYDASSTALEQVNFLAQQKNQTLVLDVPKELSATFDWDIIQRVLVNLLTNAIKYTPASKSVGVYATKGNQFHQLSVKDEGEGIPEEHLANIFDKFFQTNAKSSGAVRSTGLGLTFCKMVVEAHEGEIGVTSTIDQGSEFFFTLPKATDIILSESESATHQPELIQTGIQEFGFSPASKAQLATILPQLEELDIYETSKNLELIQLLEETETSISEWKKAMENALFSFDESQYQTLIEAIR